MKTHSRSVVRVVRPRDTQPDRPSRVAWSDGRGIARLGPDFTARQDLVDQGLVDQGLADQGLAYQGLADIGSRPAVPAAEPDRDVSAFWSAVFAFMEGFALYGAALHPAATMPVHAILAARKDWQSHPDDCEPQAPMQNSGGDGATSNGNVVKFDRVLPLDAQPERRWNWLRSAGEKLTVLLSHLRREREIKRAVAALMELDDRTLRDLGIRGRSEIEWTVRYCHDC